MTLPLTVVILAKNEAQDILPCLESLQPISDDIHVVDSGSLDQTVSIATAFGAHCHHHPFTGFGDQRNWAIDHIVHRYDWVLHLDADERATPEFAKELGEILSRPTEHAGYFVPSKLMLGNRWLRRCSGYPVYQVRLFHKSRMRFVNQGHGQREATEGTLGYLKQPYLHFAFSKGAQHWFEKHAAYASAEAQSSREGEASAFSLFRMFFSRDAVARRRVLKTLSFRLPFRELFRFMHMFIVKRGFMDGYAGFTYARMVATYEAMIAVNVAMHRLQAKAKDRVLQQ